MLLFVVQMFHVVTFLDSNEVEVVPDIWIDGTMCSWPNLRGEGVKKAAKKKMNPQSDWKKYEIKSLYTSGKFWFSSSVFLD